MTLGLKKLGEVIAEYIISTVGGPVPVVAVPVAQVLRPVSIQTQSLALRALRKRKPQETQALAFEWKPGFNVAYCCAGGKAAICQ